MIYTENIQVDHLGRLVECPVCKNTEFSDDSQYCRICGMSRYNICVPEDGTYGHVNPVNARYCERCGAKTTFFLQKLLRPWKEVPKEASREAAPSANDELPF